MKKVLIVLIILMGITLNTKAMTIKPTGGTTSERGGIVEIYITLTRTSSEKTISAVDGTLSYDENVLTLQSHESLMGNNWIELGDVANGKAFSFANLQFNALISETNKNIAKLTFKVKDNATLGSTNITISNPTATDENADSVNISGGSHTINVKGGESSGNLSSVNTLKSLKLSSGTISNFSPTTTTYNVIVEEDVDKVTIGSELIDTKSKYVSGYGNRQVSLNPGSNIVLIKVQAENGDIRTYTLNITRKTKENNNQEVTTNEKKDSKLNIKIKGYEFNFDDNKTNYELEIKDEDKLDIVVELDNQNEKYEILNNENIKDGTIIIIRIMSNDLKVKKEYNINIKKINNSKEEIQTNEKDLNNSKNNNIVLYIIIVLIIIVLITIILIRKNKVKKIIKQDI